MARIVALALVALAFQGAVAWLAYWPLGNEARKLRHWRGWLRLYDVGTSNLDVWLLVLLHGALTACVLAAARAPRRRGPGGGAPSPGNLRRLELAARLATALIALLLFGKAVVVAIVAPDGAAPPRAPDGSVGLACMYASIVVGVIGVALVGWMTRRRLRAWEAAAASAGGKAGGAGGAAAAGDEEAALVAPLLGGGSSSKDGGSKEPGGGGGGEQQQARGGRKGGTVSALLRLSTPDAPILAVAFVAGAGAAYFAALVPFYTGLIIDYASIDPDRRQFSATTLKLLAVAALCGALSGTRGGLFSLTTVRSAVRLRRALFGSLLRQDTGFFDVTKTGELTSRLAADCSTVADQVSLNLNVLMRSATQAAVVLAFMFSASWRLTVVTFVLIPMVLLISKVYGAYYRSLSKKVQAALASANAVAEEALSAMPTVRAHAAQDGAAAAYDEKLQVYYTLQARQAAIYSFYAAITIFLPSAVAAAVLFFGGTLVLSGKMSPGALVSFMLYQQSLSSAFSSIGDVFSSLTAAVGAADKVIELMTREPQLPPAGGYAPLTLRGDIEFSDVVFSYPARPQHTVLRGLSFAVKPGEVVALVGPSGGGKSSIIKLLQRFYVPSAGAVLLDGRSVGDYDQKWLRRHMALVSQEPVLFARTVRRNIIYGLEPADGVDAPPSQDEVEGSARQANAHGFISGFPDGYDTECGEKGLALSGGQKQRIAIARALVRRPQVLLLDEATSALDADSEAVVQEALDRLMVGRTVLVVAHRLSTIRGADRIVVIQGGAVAEAGTHEELIALNGAYAKLVARQLHVGVGGGAAGAGTRPGSASSLAGGSGDSASGGAARRGRGGGGGDGGSSLTELTESERASMDIS